MSTGLLIMDNEVEQAFLRVDNANIEIKNSIKDLAQQIRELDCEKHAVKIGALEQSKKNGLRQEDRDLKKEANKWTKTNTFTAIGVAIVVILTALDKFIF